MAQVSVSVTERVNVFGGAPSSLWNVYLWNAFKWGEGTASMVVGLGVGISATQPSTGSADITAAYVVVCSEGVTPGGQLASGSVRDEAGYYHVFANDTTDGEQRDPPSWSAGSTSTPTWATAAVSATSWS